MEEKDNMSLGVTVTGAEVPSNYQMAPRNEATSQGGAVSPTGVMIPVNAGIPGRVDKKKRGRPPKYGPDGSVSGTLSPTPISSSAPPTVGGYLGSKQGRGKSSSSAAKQQAKFVMVPMGEGVERTDGANFTPHVITVSPGEDVTAKIISFCQQGPRAICILSANGMVSNATLRQSDSSGGKLTYEGCFEIVNLCGSFTPTEREGTRYRAGRLSVSLSSPNGQVVGGCVAGLLIAACPVQIIVGSFLLSNPPELKPKKHKVQSSAPTSFTLTAAQPEKEACDGQGHNNPVSSIQNLSTTQSFQRENWPPNTHSMQERRNSTTDINISLPGGMQ